jgi:uncharacterized membrane protein HdeD (DUF308 family)
MAATTFSGADDSVVDPGSAEILRKRWGWLIALGIVQVIGGVAAMAVPAVASLVAVGMFGAILLVSAVFHVIHAFKVRGWKGFALHLLGGLLYGAAGVIVLLYPLNGAVSLMLVIGVLFIVDGSVRMLLATALKPRSGWGWFLAAGLMSIALGVMLLIMWPVGALWIIGMLFGINFLFSGLMVTMVALQARRGQPATMSSAHPASA